MNNKLAILPNNEFILILLIIATIIAGVLLLNWWSEKPLTQPTQNNYFLRGTIPPNYVKPITYGTLINKIVQCESGGNNNAVGKAGEIGLCQFKPETWEWMSGLADFQGDINNEQDQLYLLDWGIKNGYGNHWTCFGKVGGSEISGTLTGFVE